MTFYARTETVGTGAQVDFTINWPYIVTGDVKALVNSLNETGITVVGNTVTFDTAPGLDIPVVIYRQTSLDVIQSFTRAGTSSSGGFNGIFLRLQYIAQEMVDTATAYASLGSSVAGAAASAAAAAVSASAAAASALAAAAVGNGVLTTLGDLVGYNGSAAERVPIGTEGQVLTVVGANSTDLGWTDKETTPDASESVKGKVELATDAETITGTSTAHVTTPANVQAKINTLPFAQEASLTGNTITSGGLLTLAHGLGVVPKDVVLWLECTTADHGWSVGNRYCIDKGNQANNAATAAFGAAVYMDSTNVYVRFGSNSDVFMGLDKGTGGYSSFTNGSWELDVEVYA